MDKEKIYVPCSICKQSFDESTVLQNSRNDSYCTDCFKKSMCLKSGKTYCPSGDTRTNRQETETCPTSKMPRSQKVIPRPEIYVQNQYALQPSSSTTSMLSVSKRPLQCPKADCSKFISVCTLEKHFHTEHREVPVVSTHLDARCCSELFLRNIRYHIVQCVVLLKIDDEDIQWLLRERRYNSPLSEISNPVIMVMTTRIPNHGSAREEAYYEEYNIGEETTFVTAPNQKSSTEEVFRPGDRIIVWLASNVSTNLSYTVAVSTLDNEIRQKYFGPMMTLNDNPERLCKEGNCLILTQLHCVAMSCNGSKSLALDVVIHSPD